MLACRGVLIYRNLWHEVYTFAKNKPSFTITGCIWKDSPPNNFTQNSELGAAAHSLNGAHIIALLIISLCLSALVGECLACNSCLQCFSLSFSSSLCFPTCLSVSLSLSPIFSFCFTFNILIFFHLLHLFSPDSSSSSSARSYIPRRSSTAHFFVPRLCFRSSTAS